MCFGAFDRFVALCSTLVWLIFLSARTAVTPSSDFVLHTYRKHIV